MVTTTKTWIFKIYLRIKLLILKIYKKNTNEKWLLKRRLLCGGNIGFVLGDY